MISWLSKRLADYLMAQTRAGNIGPTLMLDAPDIRFTFPGENSWSGQFDGKAAHRAWLERLVRVGVKTKPDEVAVSGWPWRMTMCIRGRSWYDTSAGERIYDNHFVIWAHLRWGRMAEYEVYEDTVKAAALDEYLAGIGEPEALRARELVG